MTVEKSEQTHISAADASAFECENREDCTVEYTQREEEPWQVVVRKGKRTTLNGLTNDPKNKRKGKTHKINNQSYPIDAIVK
jgi:hypothetical protein